MIGYLPGTEALRKPGYYEIDGISINEDGAAPLFCLDINMLTGLRTPAHTELVELLKQCQGNKASLFDLVNIPMLKDLLINSANGDSRLERAVEIAHERLRKIINKLDIEKELLLKTDTPSLNPCYLCLWVEPVLEKQPLKILLKRIVAIIMSSPL